ncbi:hypothetical protein [Enterobacter asburiae]|uniref:hypothetical protein n=1 Tax=Enterobacter asburiae TaxID=61645 RepID=UPI003F546E35
MNNDDANGFFQGKPVTVTGQKGKPFSLVSGTPEDISLSRFVGPGRVLSILPGVDPGVRDVVDPVR